MLTLEQLQAGVVLPIDKPRQWTSFQAVNKVKSTVRRLYGLKKFKIGHAGTLDPLATGLLLVCIGKATKSIPTLQDGDKCYTGTMVLGATTASFDLERPVERLYPFAHITPARLDAARLGLMGNVMQVPPMFSAVKIDGQRAYEYARRDDPTVTIQPKPVNVYSFDLTAYRPGDDSLSPATEQQVAPPAEADSTAGPLYDNPLGSIPTGLPQADFRICCGKGTYIRSMARDFGLALDSGAFLASLRRESVGEYHVADAVQLADVEQYLQNL